MATIHETFVSIQHNYALLNEQINNLESRIIELEHKLQEDD